MIVAAAGKRGICGTLPSVVKWWSTTSSNQVALAVVEAIRARVLREPAVFVFVFGFVAVSLFVTSAAIGVEAVVDGDVVVDRLADAVPEVPLPQDFMNWI